MPHCGATVDSVCAHCRARTHPSRARSRSGAAMRELRTLGAMIPAIIALTFFVGTSTTQTPSPPPALTTVPIPDVDDLDDFVSSRSWAVVLGKALFWDQQVGSDGMACASCHFSAGADGRRKNQLSPSLNNLDAALRT